MKSSTIVTAVPSAPYKNPTSVEEEARKYVIAEMAKSATFDIGWADGVSISEMIGTDAGPKEFLEKVTVDIYRGRKAVPLVYQQIYNQTVDSNLPETLTIDEAGPLQVVFLQHVEGGEVEFGAAGPGVEKVVKLNEWAAGLQFSRKMEKFNQTWLLSQKAEAFGEAFNKLKNHLGMGPIVTASYTTTGGGVLAQRNAQNAGTAQLVAFDTNIVTTLNKVLQILPAGTKILCNSFDTEKIYNAIKGDFIAVNNNAVSNTPTRLNNRFNQDSFIEYDGSSVKVGKKTYTYDGVTAGTAYFLLPKAENFREYVQEDLTYVSGDPDVSRLISEQTVGVSTLGIYAALGGENGVVKFGIQ